MRVTSALVSALVVLLMGTWAFAADWPTVRGNNQRDGYTPDSVRGRIERIWAAEFPNEILATRIEAIVADGRVFVGTENGTLWAFNADTGAVLWKRPGCGPIFHSPAVFDGKVYFGDAAGTFWALDAGSGKVVWKFSSGLGGFVASPLCGRSAIYIGSRDGNFYAIDSTTGRLRWKYATDGPIRNTAARAEDTILFASDDMHAYSLGDDGSLVWKSDKLFGQSFRDYYPVLAGDKVIFRSVLIAEMNDDLNGGTAFLAANAGINSTDWKALDAFFKSDKTIATPELIRAEQEAILKRLTDNKFRRTCFILDIATGKESTVAPVMYAAGNQGCGFPPALTADGKAIIFYRTVYSNWNLGVKPAVGVGYLDTHEGWITPIRHANGNIPPWNTFWGTSDESTVFTVGGDILYICHQGTLGGLDLKTHQLFPIHGQRDTFGGMRPPPWAANEWHGPARGSCAIVGDKLYWVTGSRVLCIRGKGAAQ